MIDNQRAKWKAKSTSGYWIFGTLEKIDGSNVGAVWQRKNGRQSALANIDAKTICLSTGIQDSDGNLIYENDFVQVRNPGVKNEKRCYIWFDKPKTTYKIQVGAAIVSLGEIIKEVEEHGWIVRVVGNKFDED